MMDQIYEEARSIWKNLESQLGVPVKMPSIQTLKHFPFTPFEISDIVEKYYGDQMDKVPLLGVQTEQYNLEMGLTISGRLDDKTWGVGPIILPEGMYAKSKVLLPYVVSKQFGHAAPQILQPAYGAALGVINTSEKLNPTNYQLDETAALCEDAVASIPIRGLEGAADQELAVLDVFDMNRHRVEGTKKFREYVKRLKVGEIADLKDPINTITPDHPIRESVSEAHLQEFLRQTEKFYSQFTIDRIKSQVI